MITPDNNAVYYGTLIALSNMAKELGENAEHWEKKAEAVREKLFEICYDGNDDFFYDVDKNGRQRKYLSSTIFHLFMEGVLDKNEDKELMEEIYRRHISNEKEFNTPYPYPAMAVCDPSSLRHKKPNSWGYYSQGLIALRSTLWMEKYGFTEELDRLAETWLEAWTGCYDDFKLGQELDPISGEPSGCSEWYSSTMLFYLFAAERLKNK
jgi:neutral trehalase